MTATILKFPIRESIRVERELGGECWVVITHRNHGWAHGDFHSALCDAHEIAAGYGAAVRPSAGISAP
jgi:hypothetical protein